ncbi:hypothetical protein J2Y58_003694 [Sphingomonas sp. BE138]|uniref:transposase n=1 Tax=Sphingomonas sp. BE138 TaxID=2817845 RepID=UPI002864CAC4|nr:transposase [Sphingomonas sp. BE138]MDR6790314.1 hypothetical protein [Sphingomonas sp. BE138]
MARLTFPSVKNRLLRDWLLRCDTLAKADVEAVIPGKSNRRTPIPHDRAKYRWRNLIERLFSKLKNWRRVATRYDKMAVSYLGFVTLASVKLWQLFVHDAY